MNDSRFQENLKTILASQKSVNSFAKKSGILEGLLRNYVAGKSSPGLDKLIAIAGTAGVSLDWLVLGEGPMMRGEELKAYQGEIDVELHVAVMNVVDELLESMEKQPTREQKSRLIAALYRLASERKDHTIDRTTALQLVKLMAA